MGNKLSAFLIGFVLVGVGILAVVLILSRPDQISSPETPQTLTSADLQNAQKLSTGLENFGNLPFNISSDQIGRSNPFESY